MTRSWNETQSLAERAARGAGVPFAQAARFAVGVTRHLSEGRRTGPIAAALDNPEIIHDLTIEVERIIEAASVSGSVWQGTSGSPELLQSVIESLPCASAVTVSGDQVHAHLVLSQPPSRARPARVKVPEKLHAQMNNLAQLTYVPDSAESRSTGAGAELMELD